MFQDLWSGNGAIFSNMPNQKNRCISFFSEALKFCRTFSYL